MSQSYRYIRFGNPTMAGFKILAYMCFCAFDFIAACITDAVFLLGKFIMKGVLPMKNKIISKGIVNGLYNN